MSLKHPINDENSLTHTICSRCNAVLPPHAYFCGICGKQIVSKTAAIHAAKIDGTQHKEGENSDVQVIPSHSQTDLKSLQSYKLLKNKKLSEKAYTSSSAKQWGWFPALSLTGACGLLLIALAYEGGRLAANWAIPLYWCGMVILFLPIALRLFSKMPSRRERIALLVVLAMLLYFVQCLQYPLYFSGYDEFLHWRTAQDIIASGHLFHENPLLPISAYYPGLEIVTTTVSNLTGLSLHVSGVMVIGVVQVVFVLSLYLLYEHFTGSGRIAGIATILYMANPGYLFFDMEFAYESLALPLAVFVLFVLARRSTTRPGHRNALTLTAWLGLGAITITHHLTSYALVAFLVLWTVIFLLVLLRAFLDRYRQGKTRTTAWVRPGWGPGGAALLGLALVIAWLIFTGGRAVNYLSPHIDNALSQVVQILARQGTPRQLFHNPSGFTVPLWERIMSIASVALILLGLPFGLYRIWQRYRMNAAVLALGIASLAYPVSQALRLTAAGAEAGSRATEFLYLGIAFVLAIGATEFWLSHTPGWRRSAVVLSLVGVLCFGQMILGSGQPWSLLPGPYLVSADARSIEPQGITAAQWANNYLGPGNRVASDRINTLLMATYGNQQVVTGSNGNSPVSAVFDSLQVGPGVTAILQDDRVHYLVIDLRLSTSLPYVGTYFNFPASGGGQPQKPLNRAALTKFDSVPGVSRIFDSGDIIIYDVGGLANGTLTIPTPATPIPTPKPSFPKQGRGGDVPKGERAS